MKIIIEDHEYTLSQTAEESVSEILVEMAGSTSEFQSPPVYGKFGPDTLLSLLSVHTNPKVREYVAAALSTPPFINSQEMMLDIINRLASDAQIDVIRALLRNVEMLQHIDEEKVLQLAKQKDHASLEIIAESIDWFRQCDNDLLSKTLLASNNPRVKLELSRNSNTSDEVLSLLSHDKEFEVSMLAKFSRKSNEATLSLMEDLEDDDYDKDDSTLHR